MSDDRFQDEPGSAIVDAMDVQFTNADKHTEVDKADRRFSAACMAWDKADEEYVSALYKAGLVYRDIDPKISSAWFRAGIAKRGAAYRLMMAEYTANDRKVKPCNPENPDCPRALDASGCRCSPYYSSPN